MEFALFVYAAGLVDRIHVLVWIILVVVALSNFFYAVWTSVERQSYTRRYLTISLYWICIPSLIATTIIPTEKTLWLMGGAYMTQSVIQSDVGQDFQKLISLKVKEIVEAETKNAK